MPQYWEVAPPPQLSSVIECFWHSTIGDAAVMRRVVPDGCADLLFVRGAGAPVLQVVGPMTRFQDVQLKPNTEWLGVRFRAAMGPAWLGVRASEILDETVDLDCFWGARARPLCERLADAKTPSSRRAFLLATLTAGVAPSPIQEAIQALEDSGGRLSLDVLAQQAGISARQFRRRCLDESGLSPKLLARILRFRQAWQRAQSEAGEHAILAADCGFTDQSHMIAEFRRFSGLTPGVQRTN